MSAKYTHIYAAHGDPNAYAEKQKADTLAKIKSGYFADMALANYTDGDIRLCKRCGAPFRVNKQQNQQRLYCSDECREKSDKEKALERYRRWRE